MLRRIESIVLLLFILALSNCEFVQTLFDPAYSLRGVWILDHSKTTPDQPAYNEFIVNEDDTYEIVGFEATTIERGQMFSVTRDSFETVITLQTLYPSWVGTGCYAQWSVVQGELSVTFYDDATMTTEYITFVGQHP